LIVGEEMITKLYISTASKDSYPFYTTNRSY